jgi:hypothetical protein
MVRLLGHRSRFVSEISRDAEVGSVGDIFYAYCCHLLCLLLPFATHDTRLIRPILSIYLPIILSRSQRPSYDITILYIN